MRASRREKLACSNALLEVPFTFQIRALELATFSVEGRIAVADSLGAHQFVSKISMAELHQLSSTALTLTGVIACIPSTRFAWTNMVMCIWRHTLVPWMWTPAGMTNSRA